MRLLDAQNGKFIMAKTLILIPSRMSATRLPGKPILTIKNLSIISHVFKQAKEANIGEVVVATEYKEILDYVKKNGGRAILTGRTHKTGTDRIFEAYEKLNIKDIDFILNLQGDEPNIDKNDIINLNNFMINNNSEIGTLAAEIKSDKMLNDQNVVKVITESKLEKDNFPKALNFTRDSFSKNNQNIYHHIGIYSYKTSILKKFVSLDQTLSEKQSKLEQLRALDNNLKISVALGNFSPIGEDSKEEYQPIKKFME